MDWDCDTANVYDGSGFQQLVEGVPTGRMEWSDDGRDGVVDVDRSVSFEESDASPLEILQDATRFYNGVV